MSKENNSSTDLYSILFIIFLILKLTDTIDWSWWWVTSPIWIPVVLILLFLIIFYD